MKKLSISNWLFVLLPFFYIKAEQGRGRVCLSFPLSAEATEQWRLLTRPSYGRHKDCSFWLCLFFHLIASCFIIWNKPGLSSGVWMHLITAIIFHLRYWNNMFKAFQGRPLSKADAMLFFLFIYFLNKENRYLRTQPISPWLTQWK